MGRVYAENWGRRVERRPDTVASVTPDRPDPYQAWSAPARLGFRVAFAGFVLRAILPTPVADLLVRGLARALGIVLVYRANGSGDTTYNYLLVLALALLAVLVAGIWTALDRERQAYPRLGEGLIVGIRYFLGVTMLGYGLAKLFVAQFPTPTLETLVRSIGSAPPTGLMWTFMGHSRAYAAFAGLLELAAAGLLLFRRTTTLGALLTAGVMANVVLMNLCFDVPVKLLSSYLLALAGVLIALDHRRLLAFARGRAVPAVEYPPHFASPKHRRIAAGAKLAVLLAALGLYLWVSVGGHQAFGPDRPRSPYYGVYQVEALREDGRERPGVITDAQRWRYLVFDRPGYVSVFRMDGSLVRYAAEIDPGSGPEAGTITIASEPMPPFGDFIYLDPPVREPPERHTWRVWASEGRLEISGEFDGRALALTAVAQPLEFPLTSTGFHWVQELPNNL